jgi:hypothetical protein
LILEGRLGGCGRKFEGFFIDDYRGFFWVMMGEIGVEKLANLVSNIDPFPSIFISSA